MGFRGSRGAGEAAGFPGSGRARSGDPWPRLPRVGRRRRSLRWETGADPVEPGTVPDLVLSAPAQRPGRTGVAWTRASSGPGGRAGVSAPGGDTVRLAALVPSRGARGFRDPRPVFRPQGRGEGGFLGGRNHRQL